MKIVAKPIEMVAWFTEDGMPKPIKFRIKEENDLWKIIKIDHVIERETRKVAGIQSYVYKCQSVIDGIEKRYEVKYELEKCKWFLFKV